ncbi:Y-family DNA polymerase [Thalassotalea agarivorans]|uniref:Protein ImuB n=1 Tax=Thalassotalea agarivorans TaxID=349064 RepID=A0A1I0GSS0_THASX|nr:DNA polymerase Y family protein [Thalassotalea agarivorans]SET74367.1 protein ImuB [Thalassotalea agarivorans]
MLWLYLSFPQLQLDSLYARQQSQAIAVVDEASNKVVQRNAIAQKDGIKLGMGLASAAALLPELHLVPYNKSVEQQHLKDIAQTLYQFTADIAIDPPHGLFLKVGNMFKLYQGLTAYWQMVCAALDDFGYQYTYATAYSPLAAKLLANYHGNILCSDKAQLKTYLLSLPIEAMEIDDKQLQQLQRVGIRRYEQLDHIPAKQLAKRFEQGFVQYLLKIQGVLPYPLSFYHPPLTFKQSIELLYDIEATSVLLKPLARLIAALQSFLRIRGLASCHVYCDLTQRDGQKQSVHIRSAQAIDSADKWLALATLQFERMTLSAPVTHITVRCEQLQALQQQAQDLFEPASQGLAPLELVSLLQAKLGHEQVYSVQQVNEHQPEYESQKSAPLVSSSDISADLKPLRPGYILSQAVPLQEKVDILYGPERILTNWHKTSVLRDYFVARNTHGQWCWLYRQHDGQWFIQGYFG